MELAVLIQPVHGARYRASTREPLSVTAEGATREEALARLRGLIEDRVRAGAEMVRLHIAAPGPVLAGPVWPDDPLTHDWLAGIADARRAADAAGWDDLFGPR